MRWLGLGASLALAALLAPSLLARLEAAGVVRENYRGLVLPAASGMLIVVTAAMRRWARSRRSTSWPIRTRCAPEVGVALVFVLGVARARPDRRPARWPPRRPARAPIRTRRAAGAATLRAAAHGRLQHRGAEGARHARPGAVRAGGRRPAPRPSTWSAWRVLRAERRNLFNLLDLRPGRAGKVFVAFGVVLTIGVLGHGTRSQALGLFIGPALVLLPYDLRERAMLGDVGLERARGGRRASGLILALGPTGRGDRARRARAFSLFTGSFGRSARSSNGTLCCVG